GSGSGPDIPLIDGRPWGLEHRRVQHRLPRRLDGLPRQLVGHGHESSGRLRLPASAGARPAARRQQRQRCRERHRVADLDGQAQKAVRRNADLVLIAMGTNDACGGRTGVMTKVTVFRDQFTQAMDTLTEGLPEARVHVVSIEDLFQRWESLHAVSKVANAWRSIPFCPTLLTRPTSNAPKDLERRAAVRARVLDFNAVLAQACAEYPQCTTDGGAALRPPANVTELSTDDYWHPNIAGQATLAGLVWDTLGY